MPPPDPRRYLATTGLLVVGLLAFAAAVNYFVDPFDYFGRNSLGVYISAEREAKLTGLRQHPHSAFLLGTSKAAMIDVSRVSGPAPFYNASLGGATPEEIVGLVQRIPPSAPLVVVALDFFQYGDRLPLQTDPFPAPTWRRDFGYLFNMQSLGYAFTTVSGAVRGLSPTLRPDGSYDSTSWREHYDHADSAALARVEADRLLSWRAFRFSPARLDQLEVLRAALDNRHIPYIVFINPLNAADLRLIQQAGLDPALDKWLRRVHQDFPGVIDLAISHYSSPANFFQLDPVHFYPEVGVQILNEIVVPHSQAVMSDFLYREIFLGGAPKSGTTLLLGLLESHPDLLVFPEEVALFNRAILNRGWHDTLGLARHILRHTEVRRLSEKGAPEAHPGESENQVDYSFFNYSAFEKNFLARVAADPAGGPRRVLQSLFRAYAETLSPARPGPRFLVEKTPANDYFAPWLFRAFPEAKLVQVVRDPRAVYASRRQRLLHRATRHSKAFRLVNEWNRSVQQRFTYKNAPDRFLSVRYEDLVRDPRPVVERVCAFIGVDASPLPLTPTRGGRAWGGNSSYGDNFSGISQNSLDRWKAELAPAEISWIEYHCQAGMRDCGYEILSDLSSPVRNLARWLAPVPHESALGYFKARRGSFCWHLFPKFIMRPH